MARRVSIVVAVAVAVAGVGACAAFGADNGDGDGDGAAESDAAADGANLVAEGGAAEGASPDAGCAGRITYCQTPPCAPVTFATSTAIEGLAVHSGAVYWTTGNAVIRQPTGGGNGEQVTMATGQGRAGPIVADDDGIYWFTRSDGKVWSCPLKGACAPTLIARGPIVTDNELIGMARDSQRVYWAVYGPDGGVFAAEKTAIGYVIRFSPEPSVKYVAVDGTHVYWHTNCGGAYSRRKDLTELETKLPGTACTSGAGGLVRGKSALFIGGNELIRYPLGVGGSGSLPVSSVSSDVLSGLALDCANDVYWTQPFDGGPALVRMPESAFHDDGGVDVTARETLAAQTSSTLLVAHPTGLYWASGNRIMRLAPVP